MIGDSRSEQHSDTVIREWRVRPAAFIWKATGAAGFIAAAIFIAEDGLEVGMTLAAAILLTGMALRDIVLSVRLRAAAEGITVTSGLARRHIPWGSVESIRVDQRARFGLRSELLEIDAGDELYLLSAQQLSASPQEVADELLHIRTGH